MKCKNAGKTLLLFVMFLVSFAEAALFYALRNVWVFYTPYIRFMGGALGLFILMCAVAVLSLVLFGLKYHKNAFCEKKTYKALVVIAAVFTALFLAGITGVLKISGTESCRVMLLYLKREIPWVAFLLFAVCALLILPRLKGRKKAVLAVCLALCVCCAFSYQVFPSGSVKMISDPVVLDTGSDYAVVFGTDKPGTGYISYSYQDTVYTVYDQVNGRRVADRIHAVNVPYEHLNGNSYNVGSTRVIEEYSYGSRLGKTAESEVYHFQAPEGDTQTYLTVSDWHSYVDQVYQAVSYLGDYDAVLFMGDPAAGMDFEEEALEYIVKFGGELTHGEMPAIYVRGNHETRGAFADELPAALGYEKLYYTVDRGPYTFVVLDSGEDKPDDHIEYGGMDDYRLNRTEMLKWLSGVQIKNERVITLSHAWQVCEPEPELSAEAWAQLERLGVRFMISGHTHKCRFLDGADEAEQKYMQEHPGIVTYIDGGHSGGTYISSLLTLSSAGVHFKAVNQNGDVVMDEDRSW